MKNFSIILSALLLVTLLTTSSCKKKDKGEDIPIATSSDRELMLTNIADNIVLPGYVNFGLKLEDMTTKGNAFRENPNTTTLIDLRTSWEAAYIEWQKVAVFDFGPAADNGLSGFMNIYPTNVTTIDANITSGTANLESISSYAAQGFPALDYLLNGIATTDDEIVALYTSDVDADKRKAYLLKLTNQLQSKFDLVNNAWKGTYRNLFVSKKGNDLYSSTSLMVNCIVYYYERLIRSGKFGIPSGAMLNGSVLPENVEAYYKKDIGKVLAQTAHQAFIDFFNGKGVVTGTNGASFNTYLNSLDAKDATTKVLLSETINTQFNVVNDKLALLNNNLSDEVSNNNSKMIAVYNEMQKAVRMLKVDMTSAMSVTITYTDNDGD